MWTYYIRDDDCQQQAREHCEQHGTFGTVEASGRRVVCLSPDWAHAHPGKVRAQVGEDAWRAAICPDIVLASATRPEPLTNEEAQETEKMIRRRKDPCGGCD